MWERCMLLSQAYPVQDFPADLPCDSSPAAAMWSMCLEGHPGHRRKSPFRLPTIVRSSCGAWHRGCLKVRGFGLGWARRSEVQACPSAVIGVVTQWRSILECWPPPAFRPWPTHLSGECGGGWFPPLGGNRGWYPACYELKPHLVARGQGPGGRFSIPPCARVFGL